MVSIFEPKISIYPCDRGRFIESMPKVVDLPAPLGPSNPIIVPFSTPNEFPQTAWRPLGK